MERVYSYNPGACTRPGQSSACPATKLRTAHTSDLSLELGDQRDGVLEDGELRERPIERHVQRHHAAELRERLVDVAHPDPGRWPPANIVISTRRGTHATCRISHRASCGNNIPRAETRARCETRIRIGTGSPGEKVSNLGRVTSANGGGGQSVRPCPESVNQTFNLFPSDRMRTKSRSRKT